MANFNKFYELAKFLSFQPECKTCKLCEEKVGLVYVFNKELSNFPKEDIVSTNQGGHYILRKKNNMCIYFNENEGTCKIYDKRPLACRIYPLDLMEIDGDLWWVYYPDCPIIKRFIREKKMHVLKSFIIQMENMIDLDMLEEWKSIDKAHKKIELMGLEYYNVVKFKKFGIPDLIMPSPKNDIL